MLGLPQYLWRLIPANPILLRVVETGGKRMRDMLIRSAYLGVLVVGVIIVLVAQRGTRGASAGLSELTTTSKMVFQSMSYLQLFAVALLAPIFTAGAITQEKDSQTYDILLSTPLTNAQIVLGSLLSRLFFVITLLVAGIPVFSITQIFGGVAMGDIGRSFMIAAGTAFATGALAMAIATFKVGTRRTIFAFYLFIVIYLVGLFFLDRVDLMHPVIDFQKDAAGKVLVVDGNTQVIRSQTSWLTPIHPFLAQRVVFNDKTYLPPAFGDLPPVLQRWPIGWALSSPHTFYTSFMFFFSFLLVFPSILLLRRIAQSSVNLRVWILQKLHIVSGDRTRRPRTVWHNPIAWREAKTKASAARATVLRYGFMTAGLAGAAAMLWFHTRIDSADQYLKAGNYNLAHNAILVFDADKVHEYRLMPSTIVRIPAVIDEKEGERTVSPREYGKVLSRPWKVIECEQAREIGRDGASVATSKLAVLRLRPLTRTLEVNSLRLALLAAVLIEFAVILLIVTNAAASTVTREKEDGTLDLLLATPITSRYYIWGKLRGLVSFVLPLIAIPVASVGLFVIFDLVRWMNGSAPDDGPLVLWEGLLIMPPMLIIVAAFAAIVGMHLSLRFRKTVSAVMGSVGIVVGLCATLGYCGYHALNLKNELGVIVSSFSPFNIISLLIDPHTFAPGSYAKPEDALSSRLIVFIFSSISTGAYAGIVWAMYRSMVKNFDMIARKQTGSN